MRLVFDDVTLIDAREVGQLLERTPAQVKDLIRHDLLAAVMHGGRYFVAEEEVADYARRCAERSVRNTPGRPFAPPARDPNQQVLWD